MLRPRLTPLSLKVFRVASLMCGLLMLPPAQAVTFCASSVALLNSALSLGALQNEAYTIRIVQGTYLMNADMNYAFSAPTTIEGGYTANCAARVADASNTVINIGQSNSLIWTQTAANPEAELNVDGVTFSNTISPISLSAGEVDPKSSINTSGSVRLSRVRFTQIGSGGGIIPLTVKAHSSGIYLENVLIDQVSTTGLCAVVLNSDFHASVRLNHVTADLDTGSHFCLNDSAFAAQMNIHNSILWSSGSAQFMPIFRDDPAGPMNPLTSIAFVNDIFAGLSTVAEVTVSNQINADPKWVQPSTGNYHLATSVPNSPAINSGTVIVPDGEPVTDIEGNTRVVGSAPDRGAYESVVNNFNTLTVSNTLDAGAGSLRQAMLDANSSPNIAKSIKFDIRGAGNVPICPAVIALNTTLPEIASTMSIDGYTQPLSVKNTSANAFNAKLCVLLKPASGTLTVGLRVPANASANASLILRGIGIGGFGQPLQVLGGSNHLVAGNQLGGVVNGIALPGAGLSAINFGLSASGSLIVGGQNIADRNVIGGAGFNGISIQSGVASSIDQCQIVNNLIGLTPNGQSPLANNVGISVSGSGCGISRNRVAGNTFANIWLNGGSNNVVQQNQVGITTQNIGVLNNATGILVTGSNNIIGAGGNGGAITANTVRFMASGGVVVQGEGAVGNSINANLVYENGLSGNGMDIDLQLANGSAGPTENDVGDGDNGANLLQNFPVPTQLVYTGAGNVNRPATLSAVLDAQPGTFRVDAYFSNAANINNQRGHGEFLIGQGSVNVANAPAMFSIPVIIPNQLPGGVVSLTATDAAGNTSEIGSALSILPPLLFAHGFE